MRRAFLLAIAALVLAAPAGCFPGLPARRDWTFLVYMAADNNLNYYARLDLAEMAAVGSSPEVNVLVQLDQATPGVSSARMLVKRGETADFTDLGETNTGREEELRNFLVWAARNFPARRYALVLWDHGSGVWDPEGARTSPNPASGETAFIRAVAYDDAAGYDALTTEEYTRAIRDAEQAAGFHLDVLCFDACLMQMAEVAGQLAA
ncbi:MAG: clostripain-related cysteine peptidase, partial [Bacteroidota bacterium]